MPRFLPRRPSAAIRRTHLFRLLMILVTALAVLLGVAGGVSAGPRRSPLPDREETEAIVRSPHSSTGSCGVERWSVKTGTDADAGKINLQSTTPTTIAALRALPAPSSLPSSNRIAPTETTVYQVQATLTEYKLEADSDYHLVIADASGNTMIAEIPDPACVGSSSPLLSSIEKARSEFDAKYTPTGTFQAANVPVTVTGVGFFDFLHGQTGVAPNGIELHAVLDIQFGSATGTTVTVTNPGSQSGTVGTAVSLQIHATDSAGRTLSYSAAGLPAGLSINAASGLISGTPATAGSSTVTVTATDTAGVAGSATFSWAVSSSGGGTQLLGNPGFETGTATPWTASSSVVSNSTSEPPHAGSWDAWLDGYGSTHTDTLAQTVTVPASASTATLSFWLHIDTAETTATTAYDTLTVQVLGSSGSVLATLATYSNLDAAAGYTQHSFSLGSYAGQTITLRFTGAEDYTAQTSFVIDDTALNTT
ncbi:MAG: putative Ig domain-containing protein [Gemmatimonadota bacterium]